MKKLYFLGLLIAPWLLLSQPVTARAANNEIDVNGSPPVLKIKAGGVLANMCSVATAIPITYSCPFSDQSKTTLLAKQGQADDTVTFTGKYIIKKDNKPFVGFWSSVQSLDPYVYPGNAVVFINDDVYLTSDVNENPGATAGNKPLAIDVISTGRTMAYFADVRTSGTTTQVYILRKSITLDGSTGYSNFAAAWLRSADRTALLNRFFNADGTVNSTAVTAASMTELGTQSNGTITPTGTILDDVGTCGKPTLRTALTWAMCSLLDSLIAFLKSLI